LSTRKPLLNKQNNCLPRTSGRLPMPLFILPYYRSKRVISNIRGTLDDGKPYEGVSLVSRELNELGDLLFSEGKIVNASVEEHERRLRTAGLINHVVRPLQRAAHGVYEDGGDLLDERFDVLPGFSQ